MRIWRIIFGPGVWVSVLFLLFASGACGQVVFGTPYSAGYDVYWPVSSGSYIYAAATYVVGAGNACYSGTLVLYGPGSPTGSALSINGPACAPLPVSVQVTPSGGGSPITFYVNPVDGGHIYTNPPSVVATTTVNTGMQTNAWYGWTYTAPSGTAVYVLGPYGGTNLSLTSGIIAQPGSFSLYQYNTTNAADINTETPWTPVYTGITAALSTNYSGVYAGGGGGSPVVNSFTNTVNGVPVVATSLAGSSPGAAASAANAAAVVAAVGAGSTNGGAGGAGGTNGPYLDALVSTLAGIGTNQLGVSSNQLGVLDSIASDLTTTNGVASGLVVATNGLFATNFYVFPSVSVTPAGPVFNVNMSALNSYLPMGVTGFVDTDFTFDFTTQTTLWGVVIPLFRAFTLLLVTVGFIFLCLQKLRGISS